MDNNNVSVLQLISSTILFKSCPDPPRLTTYFFPSLFFFFLVFLSCIFFFLSFYLSFFHSLCLFSSLFLPGPTDWQVSITCAFHHFSLKKINCRFFLASWNGIWMKTMNNWTWNLFFLKAWKLTGFINSSSTWCVPHVVVCWTI